MSLSERLEYIMIQLTSKQMVEWTNDTNINLFGCKNSENFYLGEFHIFLLSGIINA